MQSSERIDYTEQSEHRFYSALREQIRRMVQRYVRSGDDDIEDLTQDCLVKVFNNLESLRNLERIEPWLRAIVRNAVFTWYRQRKREQEVCSIGLEWENEPAGCTIWEEEMMLYIVLQEVMQILSDSDQQMLELRYGDGMCYREIAQQMGLNEELVRKRVGRALIRLRTHPTVQSILAENG